MDLSVEEYFAVRRLNYVCVHKHVFNHHAK